MRHDELQGAGVEAEGETAAHARPNPPRGRVRLRRVAAGALTVMLLLGSSGLWFLHKRNMRRHHARPSQALKPRYPDPPGIVLHASDTPGRIHGRLVTERVLADMHRRDHPGWKTVFEGKTYYIGYHYVIAQNGAIEQGRPDHCPGAHAKKHNDWIGICVVGAFSTASNPHWRPSRPTPQQVKSTIALCERLMSEYHIPPERVKRHRDLRETWCPGSRFPYQGIMQSLRAYASTHPETHPLVPIRTALQPQPNKIN